MKRELIRANGTREEIHCPLTMDAINTKLGGAGLDTINLRDGRVMLVNDIGHQLGLPFNAEASKLYWGICRPGTTHQIVGDVIVTFDSDF